MKSPAFIILLTVFIVRIPFSFGQKSTNFKPIFRESAPSLFKIAPDQEYTFGYLEVPENRSDTQSRIIKLPVYIFKSRSPNPKPDPVIYTVGGPGSTTMPSAQYMKFYRYLDDRDFILFEQRGTYYAQPHLDCPEWSEAIYRSNAPGFDEARSGKLFADAAADCRKRLMEQGIDLDGYNTNEIAADIEDLRKVLGIERYNLLTISYSTKIAQVLLRDYPGPIRSVVMDSPLPLEVNYDEESVGNLLEAVDMLLADCAASSDCNEAFPDLKNRFFNYLQRINAQPLEVEVENPNTGGIETFKLRGKDLITVFTAAGTGNVPAIPLEMEKILNNDLTAVKAQLASLFDGPGSGAGQGMRLSVWCTEETPFASPSTIRTETDKYPPVKGLSPAVFEPEICRIWGVKAASAIENKPVKSDIPVLLISGEYDNETPPKWAAAMQQNLSNSYHLIFPGWKHTPTTNWGNNCAMLVANAFFNDPLAKPKLDCFREIESPAFKLE